MSSFFFARTGTDGRPTRVHHLGEHVLAPAYLAVEICCSRRCIEHKNLSTVLYARLRTPMQQLAPEIKLQLAPTLKNLVIDKYSLEIFKI